MNSTNMNTTSQPIPPPNSLTLQHRVDALSATVTTLRHDITTIHTRLARIEQHCGISPRPIRQPKSVKRTVLIRATTGTTTTTTITAAAGFPWDSIPMTAVTAVSAHHADGNGSDAAAEDDNNGPIKAGEEEETTMAASPLTSTVPFLLPALTLPASTSTGNKKGDTNNEDNVPKKRKRSDGRAASVHSGKQKAATADDITELEETLADLMRKINDIKLGSGLGDDPSDIEEEEDEE
ncbi:hypothetical protein B0J18DRAFT_291698 [Chaetomium sp. MPI-SDFR-AT-0129]|nr:hypothetical protein B0J18DRAFT_291698 [Chaetomium sp. MPI-SDFR-AT-0129]